MLDAAFLLAPPRVASLRELPRNGVEGGALVAASVAAVLAPTRLGAAHPNPAATHPPASGSPPSAEPLAEPQVHLSEAVGQLFQKLPPSFVAQQLGDLVENIPDKVNLKITQHTMF